MQIAVYAHVAFYPVKVPGIKNACIKWSWRKRNRRGWCQMPPDISYRFDDESEYEWCEMMTWIEEVFGSIYAVAYAVITNSAVAACDKLTHITCWVSNLEIGVMKLIFQSPQLSEKTAREKQKAEVCHKIAVMVATQVLELVKVGYPAVTRHNIQCLHGGEDNLLLRTIMLYVRDDSWPIIEPAVAREKTVLAPTVTAMDAQGRATTERETVLEKKGTSVDVLPWPKCVEFKTPYPDNHRSKLLLEAAIRQLHRPFMEYPPPISMVRAGKRIEMRATERLAKGKCVIPIFFRKPDSMVMEDDQCGARPRNGVCCTVSFTRHLESIVELERSGEFAADVSVNVFIAPEVNVPKRKVNTALAWANG